MTDRARSHRRQPYLRPADDPPRPAQPLWSQLVAAVVIAAFVGMVVVVCAAIAVATWRVFT